MEIQPVSYIKRYFCDPYFSGKNIVGSSLLLVHGTTIESLESIDNSGFILPNKQLTLTPSIPLALKFATDKKTYSMIKELVGNTNRDPLIRKKLSKRRLGVVLVFDNYPNNLDEREFSSAISESSKKRLYLNPEVWRSRQLRSLEEKGVKLTDYYKLFLTEQVLYELLKVEYLVKRGRFSEEDISNTKELLSQELSDIPSSIIESVVDQIVESVIIRMLKELFIYRCIKKGFSIFNLQLSKEVSSDWIPDRDVTSKYHKRLLSNAKNLPKLQTYITQRIDFL